MNNVKCLACGFIGTVGEFQPMTIYVEYYRCPSCGSTHGENADAEYQARLFARMREIAEKEKEQRL